MDTDPEVRRFMGGPLDPEIHRNGVMANIIAPPPRHWAWAIEWKDCVGFLGMCLLRPLEGTDFICIGWRLMRQHWGHELLCRLFEFLRRYLDGLAFVNRLDFANPFALRGELVDVPLCLCRL